MRSIITALSFVWIASPIAACAAPEEEEALSQAESSRAAA